MAAHCSIQYCLKNSRGAWWVTKSRTCLSTHAYSAMNIVEVAQSCPNFATAWTVACQAPPSMGFSRQEYWSRFPCPPPGVEPRSPKLQADSLPSEPPGKPKNTGVGSLSLLQGIFLIQKLNQGLLHCRWILY